MYLPAEEESGTILRTIKTELNITELFYLNTCNRVFYLFVTNEVVDEKFIHLFFEYLQPNFSKTDEYWDAIILKKGEPSVRHLFEMTSSLDSMVLGEREILHQVRTAFQYSTDEQLSGDYIKIAIERAVLAAKAVFTETKLGAKPISVVSLAVQQLAKLNLPKDVRILIVGAGQTNILLSKILLQYGFQNFKVFNRTIQNARNLAKKLNGEAFVLDEIYSYIGGFDVLVTCTASTEPIITTDVYENLLNGDTSQKILMDLSIPYNIDPEIAIKYSVHHIEIEILRALADKNLMSRKEEIVHAKEVIERYIHEFQIYFHQRLATKKMQHLPKQINDISKHALEKVFEKRISKLDPESKELLEEIVSYIEKKYVNSHFVHAKETVNSIN